MFNVVLMAALATGTQTPDFFFKNRRSCKSETVACTTEVMVKGSEVKGGQAAAAPATKGQGAQAPAAGSKGAQGAAAPATKGQGAQAPAAGTKGAQGAQAPAGKGSK